MWYASGINFDTSSTTDMLTSFLQTVLQSKRQLMLGVGLICLLLLGVGYFLELVVGLTPCALCIIQRGFFLSVGIVALAGWWHNRFFERYGAGMLTLALLGGAVALRNVYIQLVPQGLGTKCIPWLESFTDAITVLFQATGDCSKRDWTLLWLSIPEWSLLSFLFLIGTSIWLMRKEAVVSEVQ